MSTDKAARIIMVTPERVRQLAKGGWFARMGRDQWQWLTVVQGYIRFLREESRSGQTAKARVLALKAEEMELKIEERSRTLIHEAEAQALAVVDAVIGPLKADLMAVPARVAEDLTLRRRIEDEIDEVLRAAGDRAEDLAVEEPPGRLAAEAEAPDDP